MDTILQKLLILIVMKKLKIAVIWEYDKAKWTQPIQHDGLREALSIVEKEFQVDWFLEGKVPDINDGYDFVCPWGVGSMPTCETIDKYIHSKKILICAGHPSDLANIGKFDHVFVESPAVYQQMLPFCKSISVAFGTNTEFFKPDPDEPKILDVFFPATYSLWKRQDLFGKSVKGLRALTCGTMQPDGVDLYNICNENGVYTQVGLMPSRLVSQLYNMSRVVCITAWHGSERTILEAQATNIPLVLVRDNELGCSLVTDETIIVEPYPNAIRAGIEQALKKTVNTRKFILEKYSHIKYAEAMLKVFRGDIK